MRKFVIPKIQLFYCSFCSVRALPLCLISSKKLI